MNCTVSSSQIVGLEFPEEENSVQAEFEYFIEHNFGETFVIPWHHTYP